MHLLRGRTRRKGRGRATYTHRRIRNAARQDAKRAHHHHPHHAADPNARNPQNTKRRPARRAIREDHDPGVSGAEIGRSSSRTRSASLITAWRLRGGFRKRISLGAKPSALTTTSYSCTHIPSFTPPAATSPSNAEHP